MNGALQQLVRPAPVAALGVLLLNDFVLKAQLGNGLTGKLSDFAGLYLFTAFWVALLPRHSRGVGIATAAAWLAWKAPLSQPLLDAWNSLGLLAVDRVVDPTDLAALVMVPLACLARASAPRTDWRRLAGPAMAALCVFSFGATSVAPERPVDLPSPDYRLPISAEVVLTRLYTLRLDYDDRGLPYGLAPGGPSLVTLTLPPQDAKEAEPRPDPPRLPPTVQFQVEDAAGGSVVRLSRVWMHGRVVPRDSLRARFERDVLERVRRNEPNPFPRPPEVAGGDAHFGPRLISPISLTEPRGELSVSLARPAYLAVIEVGGDEEWRVIFPVDSAVLLPAGRSRVTTLCATTKVRGDYGLSDPVPPCGVTAPLSTGVTPGGAPDSIRDAIQIRHRNPAPSPRLLLLASDAPISRQRLAVAIRDPGFPRQRLRYGYDMERALGRIVRQSGGSRAAASETILRR
jgi:hypothetical protein